jgi:hypothetical protein
VPNDVHVDPLRFTNEDSFGLFMEALRSLQHYEDETAKTRPAKAELDRTMQSALLCLRECTSRYIFDLLPTFYLGIALGMKNQEVYVQRLFELTTELHAWGRVLACDDHEYHARAAKSAERRPAIPTTVEQEFAAKIREGAAKIKKRAYSVARPYKDLDERRWPLLEEASRLFETLTEDSCPDNVRNVARYNLAQVFARRGSRRNITYLQDALAVLTKSEFKVDVNQLLSEIQKLEADHRSKFPDSADISLPPAARRKRDQEIEKIDQDIRSRYEQIALSFQFASLQQSLVLRLAACNADFVSDEFTTAYDAFANVGTAIIENRQMRDPGFKADLLADYLTKVGYINYELANNRTVINDPNALATVLKHEPQTTRMAHLSSEVFLSRSARFLTAALELKEQWNPAQIYLAVVRRVQAGIVEGKIELIKSEKELKLANLAADVREIEREITNIDDRERQLDRVPVEATEKRRRLEDAIETTASLKRRLAQTKLLMEQESTPFDQRVADHELERQRFDAESDELFAVLQGLPWPPAPKPPEFGDG